MPVTVHAGEWPCGGEFGSGPVDNLALALRLGVDRIGHGCALFADQSQSSTLVAQAVAQGVTVECCLTSNVGWKVKSYAVHPITDMLRAGVRVSLNCDNLLLSGSAARRARPSGEALRFLRDVNGGLGFSPQTLLQVLANGLNGSFVMRFWPDAERLRFTKAFTKECERVLLSLAPAAVATPRAPVCEVRRPDSHRFKMNFHPNHDFNVHRYRHRNRRRLPSPPCKR